MRSATVPIHGLAVGGEGVGRLPDGRVAFVAATAPGDRVAIEVTEERKRHVRGRVVEVVEPGPARVEPPCPFVGRGCGGCDWQHLAPAARPELAVGLVADVMRRQGRWDAAAVEWGGAVPEWGYRTTVRLAAAGDTVGFRRARSHDVVAVDVCAVAAPPLVELVAAPWEGHGEVTLRCSLASGARIAIVGSGVVAPLLPDDVMVVEHAARSSVHLVEAAAGRTWRVSGGSFFQSGPHAADLLVATVRRLLGDDVAAARRAVDLCAGVGLLAGSLAELVPDASWEIVEAAKPAVADARVNLVDLDVEVRRRDVDAWRPVPADVVIADPPRTGLGRRVVASIAATGASRVVLVSCDLGSLGRDVGLLSDAGYVPDAAVVLDLFPQTSHLEVVTSLRR